MREAAWPFVLFILFPFECDSPSTQNSTSVLEVRASCFYAIHEKLARGTPTSGTRLPGLSKFTICELLLHMEDAAISELFIMTHYLLLKFPCGLTTQTDDEAYGSLLKLAGHVINLSLV